VKRSWPFVTLFVLALSATAVAKGATFVSDTYVGPGVGHFQYYGRWEHVRHFRDGRLFGTSSRTASLGAAVTLSFVGTVVQLYGVRGPGGGHAIITLDGQRFRDLDFYAPHKTVRAVVFTSPDLSQGLHRLTLAALGDARVPGHRSSYVNISGAVYK